MMKGGTKNPAAEKPDANKQYNFMFPTSKSQEVETNHSCGILPGHLVILGSYCVTPLYLRISLLPSYGIHIGLSENGMSQI
jgi:hypothetical protein